jgi:hypothetical protein
MLHGAKQALPKFMQKKEPPDIPGGSFLILS